VDFVDIIVVIKIFVYTVGLVLHLNSSHKTENYYYWFQRAHDTYPSYTAEVFSIMEEGHF